MRRVLNADGSTLLTIISLSNECEMRNKIIKTSLGWVGVALSEQGVSAVVLPRKSKTTVIRELESAHRSAVSGPRADDGLLNRAMKQLERYFTGHVMAFDLPLDLHAYTSFQQAVWKAAASIPYGETCSYGWIAKRIGKPNAARAVGRAMGANPVPLLVP